jgi:hypothetical protein
MAEIVPFLECVLEEEYLAGWGHLMKKLEGYFNSRWGSSWKKSEEEFWRKFGEKSLLRNGGGGQNFLN